MVSVDGCVGASAPVASASTQTYCSPNLSAVVQPPVSATSDRVYFRDGDTQIRYLTPAGKIVDATSVPGGPTTISAFSVSPDDKRIAVVVEDLSNDPIKLRLYVEDVDGGGHHVDIYSTTTPKSTAGTTLWPMGWHNGSLVLELWPACSTQQAVAPYAYPLEWHVVDPATGVRLVTIGGNSCIPSYWPSPAGLTCFDYAVNQIRIYDWNGNQTSTVPVTRNAGYGLELSPSGKRLMYATGMFTGLATTTVADVARPESPWSGSGWPPPCLWIDDDHILAWTAVINAASVTVTTLPVSGACMGRFPANL
jgi:hypothetical protein